MLSLGIPIPSVWNAYSELGNNNLSKTSRLMKQTRLFAAVTFGLLAWGCGTDKEDNAQPTVPELEIVSDNTDTPFPQDGGSATVTFTANMDWTASTDQPWCTVEPGNGEAGTVTLTVSAIANTDYDERNAALRIACGTEQKTITVTQKQRDAILLSADKQEIGQEGGRFGIEVASNVDFAYEIDADAQSWITTADTRSLEGSTLYFSVSPNNGPDRREGHIRFSYGTLEETVTVYQEGETPTLMLSQNTFSLGAEGGLIKTELQSNVDYTMTMPQDGWVRQVTTRTISTYTLTFEVDPNTDPQPRDTYISFEDKEHGLIESLNIHQDGYEAPVLTPEHELVELDCEEHDILVNVRSNVDYSISTGADWITETVTRTATTTTHRFHVEASQDFYPREAEIVFSNGEYGLTGTTLVRQSPRDAILPEKQTCTVSGQGETIVIAVRANVDYGVYAMQTDWYTWEDSSTDGENHRLSITVQPNITTEERTATFTLSGGSAETTIIVTQQAGNSTGGSIDDMPHIDW